MKVDIIRRSFFAFLGILGFHTVPTHASILDDVLKSASDGADALKALGYGVDFSFESIKELERFMEDNVMPEGGAKQDSQLSEKPGGKLFMLGSYLGEVIRRKTNGQWRGDDNDPDVTINVEVLTSDGATIWPIQRIMKRFQNGEEDNLWDYAQIVLEP